MFKIVLILKVSNWKDHKPTCLAKTSEIERLNNKSRSDSSNSQPSGILITELENENSKTPNQDLKREEKQKANPLNELD